MPFIWNFLIKKLHTCLGALEIVYGSGSEKNNIIFKKLNKILNRMVCLIRFFSNGLSTENPKLLGIGKIGIPLKHCNDKYENYNK
ncbi:hypothetical protein BpHYR1_021061 [Brachionus plicatilis]|uniref:Uncharacterized protein n=1 Tax=Brachionus plicatilis TaxID=10195 RepID=A0A3M7QG11_BRAPC|nr:hypothetical protein BpHYR1_021061 [Brachionus plicatilis]